MTTAGAGAGADVAMCSISFGLFPGLIDRRLAGPSRDKRVRLPKLKCTGLWLALLLIGLSGTRLVLERPELGDLRTGAGAANGAIEEEREGENGETESERELEAANIRDIGREKDGQIEWWMDG